MTEPTWGTLRKEMMNVLAETPADVAGVVAKLSDLQIVLDRLTPMDDANPVSDFNRLYHTITAMILGRLDAGDFADSQFLTLLDVEFARRYFDALRQWGTGSRNTPRAWMVLFRRLDDREVRSVPAAAAGVNAHINYDLPFALVSTWEQLGSGPIHGPQLDDYLLINHVFSVAIPGLRRRFLERWQLQFDRLNGTLDDWYQNRLVEFTRGLAWESGERIWTVRHDRQAYHDVRTSLDRNAALLGRALLSPIASLLQ